MSMGVGFFGAAVAVLCFGSSFVPVKKYDTSDGVFYQWVMCNAIFLFGIVVQFIRGSPPFEPIAAIGGILWCTGNITAVPIIQCIGLGFGMLLWGVTNLFMGWASGYFGLMGLKADDGIKYRSMNVAGLCIALASMTLLFFLKPNTPEQQARIIAEKKAAREGRLPPNDLNAQLIDPVAVHDASQVREAEAIGDDGAAIQPKSQHQSWTDRLSPSSRRLVGIGLALAAGVFYGINFNPPQYLIDSGRGTSAHGIDYVFSHFTGIFIASNFFFLAYLIYTRSEPSVNPKVILPAFVSGGLWAIAQISWFIANDSLGFAISFPLITTGPGLVACLWGIFAFGEISGTGNYLLLTAAFAATVAGATLISLSKVL